MSWNNSSCNDNLPTILKQMAARSGSTNIHFTFKWRNVWITIYIPGKSQQIQSQSISQMVCKEIQSHPFLFIMVFSPTNQLFFVLYNTINSFFNGFLAYKAANQLIFVLPINTISILLGSSVSLTWSFMERQTVEVKEIKAFWEGVKSSNAPPWCRLFVWQMTIYCKRELPSC